MNKIVCFVIFTCIIFPCQIFGRLSLSENNFEQANNNVTLSIIGLGINYGEKTTEAEPLLPPQTNNKETGVIPGLSLGARATFYKKVYAELHCDYSSEKLKFDGADQAYPYTPRIYRLRHRIVNADSKFGYILLDKEHFQFIPYVGIGYRFWDRSYNSDNNREKYYSFNAFAGMKMNFLITENLFLSPYVQGGEIFNAKMKQISNDLNFDLGNQPIFQGGVELNYRLFDEFFLNFFVNYTHFQYGKSSCVVPPEPKSKTDEVKAGVGISFSWIP